MSILETRMTWLRFLFQYGMGDGLIDLLEDVDSGRRGARLVTKNVDAVERLKHSIRYSAPTAGQGWIEELTMAEWKVWDYDTPQCTHCGMWMPFARYRRGQGTDARWITDFCPQCGAKMTAMPMCCNCEHGKGEWKDDGICYACREQVWIPGKIHRKVGEEP